MTFDVFKLAVISRCRVSLQWKQWMHFCKHWHNITRDVDHEVLVNTKGGLQRVCACINSVICLEEEMCRLLSSTSFFYIHHVVLFPMKLVAYSSAVWQIRCAAKWSMTEGRARLDPLQSYTAITVFFISVGKYPRMAKKIRLNLIVERSGVARESFFVCLFVGWFDCFPHSC